MDVELYVYDLSKVVLSRGFASTWLANLCLVGTRQTGHSHIVPIIMDVKLISTDVWPAPWHTD